MITPSSPRLTLWLATSGDFARDAFAIRMIRDLLRSLRGPEAAAEDRSLVAFMDRCDPPTLLKAMDIPDCRQLINEGHLRMDVAPTAVIKAAFAALSESQPMACIGTHEFAISLYHVAHRGGLSDRRIGVILFPLLNQFLPQLPSPPLDWIGTAVQHRSSIRESHADIDLSYANEISLRAPLLPAERFSGMEYYLPDLVPDHRLSLPEFHIYRACLHCLHDSPDDRYQRIPAMFAVDVLRKKVADPEAWNDLLAGERFEFEDDRYGRLRQFPFGHHDYPKAWDMIPYIRQTLSCLNEPVFPRLDEAAMVDLAMSCAVRSSGLSHVALSLGGWPLGEYSLASELVPLSNRGKLQAQACQLDPGGAPMATSISETTLAPVYQDSTGGLIVFSPPQDPRIRWWLALHHVRVTQVSIHALGARILALATGSEPQSSLDATAIDDLVQRCATRVGSQLVPASYPFKPVSSVPSSLADAASMLEQVASAVLVDKPHRDLHRFRDLMSRKVYADLWPHGTCAGAWGFTLRTSDHDVLTGTVYNARTSLTHDPQTTPHHLVQVDAGAEIGITVGDVRMVLNSERR